MEAAGGRRHAVSPWSSCRRPLRCLSSVLSSRTETRHHFQPWRHMDGHAPPALTWTPLLHGNRKFNSEQVCLPQCFAVTRRSSPKRSQLWVAALRPDPTRFWDRGIPQSDSCRRRLPGAARAVCLRGSGKSVHLIKELCSGLADFVPPVAGRARNRYMPVQRRGQV